MGDFGEVARKVMRGDALLWLAWDGARDVLAFQRLSDGRVHIFESTENQP